MQTKVDIFPLYENEDFVVCEKPPFILTLPSESEEKSLIDFLSDYYREKNKKTELFPVHRLDRLTGGLVVFAKNKRVAAELSQIFSEHRNEKEYLAVLDGSLREEETELRDLLFADKRKNKSFVVDKMRKGAKEAILSYKVLKVQKTEKRDLSLVKIILKTGRMHQIRAQLSHVGAPVLGDGKYGSKDNRCELALWAHRLSFECKGKAYEFFSYPEKSAYPWECFKNEI